MGEGKNNFIGYYTVGIKLEKSSLIHIYWNNKKNLNYFELTPNTPSTMTVSNNTPLYF